jgi:hypothetical protein
MRPSVDTRVTSANQTNYELFLLGLDRSEITRPIDSRFDHKQCFPCSFRFQEVSFGRIHEIERVPAGLLFFNELHAHMGGGVRAHA